MEDDTIIARILQSEEDELNKPSGSGPDLQALEDEDFARRIADQELRSTGKEFVLTSGQQALVKLHHPATSLQIGEILLAQLIKCDEMIFEMTISRGKYLKLTATNSVEFSLHRTSEAIFKIENSASGHLYLYSTSSGPPYNYLTMTPEGRLLGQCEKGPHSEWQLITVAALLNAATSGPPPPLLQQREMLDTTVNPLLGPGSQVKRRDDPLPNRLEDTTRQHSSPARLRPAPSRLTGSMDLSVDVSRDINSSSQRPVPTLDLTGFPGYNAGDAPLMRYFQTDNGFQFLQSPGNEAAFLLYLRNGLLAKLLHRPDWLLVARRFRDYSHEPVPSLQLESIQSYLSPRSIWQQFFESGYTVLTNVVPTSLLNAAKRMINSWIYQHQTASSSSNAAVSNAGLVKGRYSSLELQGAVCQDVDIIALYYESCLPPLTQLLLGANDVVHPSIAQIILHYPTLDVTLESPALYGTMWRIEGFTGRVSEHSPYNLLIGIALTDMDEADMGNFCVHPASHISLMEQYREDALQQRTVFSDDPQVSRRPDLGPPLQICMRAGDVVICTQRLATLFSLNSVGAQPSQFVFFRVSHVDHAVLKNPALDSLWLEFPIASRFTERDPISIVLTDNESIPVCSNEPFGSFPDDDAVEDSLLGPNIATDPFAVFGEAAFHPDSTTISSAPRSVVEDRQPPAILSFQMGNSWGDSSYDPFTPPPSDVFSFAEQNDFTVGNTHSTNLAEEDWSAFDTPPVPPTDTQSSASNGDNLSQPLFSAMTGAVMSTTAPTLEREDPFAHLLIETEALSSVLPSDDLIAQLQVLSPVPTTAVLIAPSAEGDHGGLEPFDRDATLSVEGMDREDYFMINSGFSETQVSLAPLH